MPYELYKILHLFGIFLIIVSLGGVLLHVRNGGDKSTNTNRKTVMTTHGIGMLLSLVGGFGILARLGIHSLPGWVLAKLFIWLFLGAAVPILYRKPNLAKPLWIGIPAIAGFAGFLAIYKPF